MARLRRPERPEGAGEPPPSLVRFRASDWEDPDRPVSAPAPPGSEVKEIWFIDRRQEARRRWSEARAAWAAEHGIRRWGWTPGVTYEEWARAGKP